MPWESLQSLVDKFPSLAPKLQNIKRDSRKDYRDGEEATKRPYRDQYGPNRPLNYKDSTGPTDTVLEVDNG